MAVQDCQSGAEWNPRLQLTAAVVPALAVPVLRTTADAISTNPCGLSWFVADSLTR
jgi:hypothetical protein